MSSEAVPGKGAWTSQQQFEGYVKLLSHGGLGDFGGNFVDFFDKISRPCRSDILVSNGWKLCVLKILIIFFSYWPDLVIPYVHMVAIYGLLTSTLTGTTVPVEKVKEISSFVFTFFSLAFTPSSFSKKAKGVAFCPLLWWNQCLISQWLLCQQFVSHLLHDYENQIKSIIHNANTHCQYWVNSMQRLMN